MKNSIIKITTIIAFALVPVLFCGMVLGAAISRLVYDDSYYAALNKQYERLSSVEGNKVLLVGGSNVAFGADSSLFEKVYGKPLVSVGLYGIFGVSLMMELSKINLVEGDTVVLAPELSVAAYTTTVNYEALWKASEANRKLLRLATLKNGSQFIGSILPFALNKREYLLANSKPQNEGIYTYDNVNEYGEIAKGLRPNNIMRNGYMGEDFLSSGEQISPAFLSCVNDYVAYCALRGVRVLFSFSPLNGKAVQKQGLTEDDLYSVYDALVKGLDCPVISDPNEYVMDYRYFYDTNFHLNDAGVVHRMVRLARDLNLYDGNYKQIATVLPQPPNAYFSAPELDESLNYTSPELFELEEDDGMYVIVGVKEEAKSLTQIVLPVYYEGKYIYNVASGAFADCKVLTRVDVPVGISELSGGAFRGCSALKEIRFYEKDSANVNVYDSTFTGVAPDCKIVLMRSKRGEFINSYMWQRVTLPIVEVSP